MQDLKELLDSIVCQATYHAPLIAEFSQEQLRDILKRDGWPDEEMRNARLAQPFVHEESISQLSNCLRLLLEDYVDQDKDRIGLAFPNGNSPETFNFEDNLLVSKSWVSSIGAFSKSLIKGAAVLGPERVTQLLSGWLQGEPVKYKTVALLNALPVNEPLTLKEDVRIEPLPLSTDLLPANLPAHIGTSADEYLDRTILTIDSMASPAFFRPQADNSERIVQAMSKTNVDIATICQALSLETNSYVGIVLFWNDYEDLQVFSFTNSGSSSFSTDTRLRRRPYLFSIRTRSSTGVTTLIPDDERPTLDLPVAQNSQILNDLQSSDVEKIRLALSRWIMSKDFEKNPVDSFIDLRIALESLYLQNIGNEKDRGEMGFRLSLYGAWHLGTNLEDRKEIQKKLKKTYAEASGAVHGRKFDDDTTKTQELLSDAQDLCRRGILKLLREGYPSDWGDLILDAEYDEELV